MWKNTLIEISHRANKRAAPAVLRKAKKAVTTDRSIPRLFKGQNTTPAFATASDAVLNSQSDLKTHLRSSALESSLSGSSPPRLRAADDNVTLLRSAETLPFLYAALAFCALIKAGEVQHALQLTSFWKYQKPKRAAASRRAVKHELLRTIRALEEVKDTATLKVLIDILSAAVREHKAAMRGTLQALSLTHNSTGPCFTQYKLFAPLGAAAAADVLARAAESVCRISGRDGVSSLERLIIMDKCVDVNVTAEGTARLPFRLYRLFDECTANGLLDAALAERVCPSLPSKLVHPSHYSAADILSLTSAEARYIQTHWASHSVFQHVADTGSQPSMWHVLASRALADSKTLQSAEANCLLVSLMSGAKNATQGLDNRAATVARRSIVHLLRNPQPAVRRHTAGTLLKKRHLLATLRISPLATASTFLKSFHTKGDADPALGRLCAAVFTQLCRLGRYSDAAHVVWNHLSAPSPATAALFKANAPAAEHAVVAVCIAMRAECRAKRAQPWMGYRSLALLGVVAAVPSSQITVMHCVSVCSSALACGVPFAAVNEVIRDILGSDPALRAWALDLVRLCSDTETVTTTLKVRRHGLSANVSSYLARVCRSRGGARDEVTLQTPSRSKQLALWGAVTKPTSNPRLNAIMTAVFLDRSARDAILECTWCRALARTKHSPSPREGAKNAPFAELWQWEVAAAVASNCTNDESFRSFLGCLKCRKPSGILNSRGNLDSITALLRSEQDAQDTGFLVSRGQGDVHHFPTT
ncbi:hypothetical protein NESM_000334000 [Novymonas esmeraldas]|uniref:Uncharacterized protein n=1 Tax=Novymonas esmeraldas TaxID=1808958 RepID=A0AAW0EJ86_9TRYP